MPHAERLSGNTCLGCAGDIILGAALGKMQHRVDVAGLQRRDQLGRKRRGDRAVDHLHFGRDAMYNQFANQIGGAVFAGEIEQRCRSVGVPLGDELHQIAHVAARRRDI